MKKKNLRTALMNFFKGLAAMAFSGLVGNIVYFLVFRGTNAENPEGGAIRSSILSLLIFALSVSVIIKMLDIEGKADVVNEKQTIKDAFREGGYQLDYKPYYINMMKTRLCGYLVATFVWQIPLVVNYIIADKFAVTVYELPIWIYEWCMPSLFAYELLGGRWYIGLPVYLVIFTAVFIFFTYRYYKQFLVKPSYL